ncbi:MAG TPA: hypothetical protein VFR05_01460 [Terriglobia bacterium]|nr:hypothetical protein [Terriglobia bacterium]
MSKEHLGTYLNDHLMGSVAALEIVDQFITEDQDLRPFLTELKTEIEADRDELLKIMHRLDISESRIRRAGGWLAEQVAEFKFAMEDHALRRLERLEALALGIQGKMSLWHALDAASSFNKDLTGVDYGRLAQRAADQHRRVENLRIDAARVALTPAA